MAELAGMPDRARAAFNAIRRPWETYAGGECLIPDGPPESKWPFSRTAMRFGRPWQGTNAILCFFGSHVTHGSVLIKGDVPWVFSLCVEKGYSLGHIWRGCSNVGDLVNLHFDKVILYSESPEDNTSKVLVAKVHWMVGRERNTIILTEALSIQDPAYCAVFKKIDDTYSRDDLFSEFDSDTDGLLDPVRSGLRYLMVDR